MRGLDFVSRSRGEGGSALMHHGGEPVAVVAVHRRRIGGRGRSTARGLRLGRATGKYETDEDGENIDGI